MSSDKNSFDPLKSYPFRFEELPLEAIETDKNQPRKTFGRKAGDHARLLNSIARYGIEEPIKVSEIDDGRYIIMDGHRRFGCAKELKFEKILCRIYPKMSPGEFEARRYEMQNNKRNWRPIEKANALHKISVEYKDLSLKEIADLVGVTQKNLCHFSDLRNMRMEYLELMAGHDMKEYQMIVFMQLLPRLRKIKQFEVDDIIKILFDKISKSVLFLRGDFIALTKVFTAASMYEEEILYFLTEPKATVPELCEMTKLSGISEQIKNLIQELSVKKSLDIKLTDKEQQLFDELHQLMKIFL